MRQYLIAPIIIALLVVGVAIASPAAFGLGSSAEEAPTPTEDPTIAPTEEPTIAPTPVVSSGAVPEGTSGRLTILRGGEFVTLQLPGGEEVAREPSRNLSAATSPDGRWTAYPSCTQECTLTITDGNDGATILRFEGGASDPRWSPDSARLAYIVDLTRNDEVYGRELTLIDPSRPDEPVVLRAIDGYAAMPYVWEDATHIVLSVGDTIERLTLDGAREVIARPAGSIDFFYESPDGHTVAYTQADAAGWRLYTLDLETLSVIDRGNMGSDPAGIQPPDVSSSAKGPMYVEWSPNGRQIAFGGGFIEPYFMTIVDLDTGNVVRTYFEEGYPGEIKWSPDGSRVAVSTYDVERTRHEVYIVDPATGDARHVSSGCVIVWSPDGRFLAQHIDHTPGVGIVNVETGEYGMLTDVLGETPLWWEE